MREAAARDATVWRTMQGLIGAALLVGSLAVAQEEALQTALRIQDAFASVAERAFPAVVVITSKRFESGVTRPRPQHPFWQLFPPSQRAPAPEDGGQLLPKSGGPEPRAVPVGRGSGVIVRSDGYILTNFHVIQHSDALQIRLQDGRSFDSARIEEDVEVVGVDEETDLAVLRIGAGKLQGLPVLEFGDSTGVRVGDWAIAVGAPFNLDYSVTIGHVSQKGRHDVGVTTFENYIQTDASINPGNSGGPLLNIRGEMIGINEFIVTGTPQQVPHPYRRRGPGPRGGGSIGLGFAIASNLARQVTDDLIEHGEVIRPFLGVGMQELTDELRLQFGVDQGVIVSEVLRDNPADRAGVQVGDVILKLGSKPVRTPNDLLFALLAYEPGDTIPLLIDRRGRQLVMEVTAARRGGGPTPGGDATDDILERFGIVLEEVGDGVVVSGVALDSPAADAGLQRGDRVLMVNRGRVGSVDDFIAALEQTRNDAVMLYIDRGGARLFVAIPLDGTD